jgi:sulfatase maturation enzyme AslB (radical SAM superfamily)
MQCKFLDHGLAIGYNSVVKPCCAWQVDQDWENSNHLTQVSLAQWHQSSTMIAIKNQLDQGTWPTQCSTCKHAELESRGSIRGDGASAYADYGPGDITLEIRPGNVCNFACQTCWPEASTRVAQFHHQAGIIDIKSVNSSPIKQFDFLEPIANRIKDLVLLGGEPFYDKDCLKFLQWATHNLTARIIMFTNGSAVDWDWIDSYPGKIVLVFSLDAVGRAAEYIRFGTDWTVVEQNFQKARTHSKVELRVNITLSAYNLNYVKDVVKLLTPNWPDVVSFGIPHQPHFRESVIPIKHRDRIIVDLQSSVIEIQQAEIESGQKSHAVNALTSVINNLQTQPWDHVYYKEFQKFVSDMDRVKHMQIRDYCADVADMLTE